MRNENILDEGGTTPESLLPLIKKEFFTFRNGIVSDTLRRSGWPHNVIFGLQLPEINAVAAKTAELLPANELPALARLLWNDREVRESRLLACSLLREAGRRGIAKPEILKVAGELRNSLRCREEEDILAFMTR